MKLSLLMWLVSLMPQPAADHACLATTVNLEARSEAVLAQQAVAVIGLADANNFFATSITPFWSSNQPSIIIGETAFYAVN